MRGPRVSQLLGFKNYLNNSDAFFLISEGKIPSTWTLLENISNKRCFQNQ